MYNMVVIAAVRDPKAVGSNPITSTKKPWKIHGFFSFCCLELCLIICGYYEHGY